VPPAAAAAAMTEAAATSEQGQQQQQQAKEQKKGASLQELYLQVSSMCILLWRFRYYCSRGFDGL
jgi:hypothetical protein